MNDFGKIKNYRHLFFEILLNELDKPTAALTRRLKSTTTGVLGGGVGGSRADIEIWLNTCCIKLKQLNYEHAQILIEHKQSVQFPDLYAELYNL